MDKMVLQAMSKYIFAVDACKTAPKESISSSDAVVSHDGLPSIRGS
jgi:hypothetical protein